MTFKINTVYKKILADLHTPVSIYNKVRDHFPNSLLLESSDYHNRTDSKSFICLDPIAGFEAKAFSYQYTYPQSDLVRKEAKQNSEVFEEFQNYISKFEALNNELPFAINGFWGYSSFEAVQYMDDITFSTSADEIKDNPDLKYQLFRFVLVFDHYKNELYITQNNIGFDDKLGKSIDSILGIIQINNLPNFSFLSIGSEKSNVTDEEYRQMVEKGIQHCKIGDTFQVVLSREFRQKFKGDDYNLYRCLRSVNPSPYLFYFDYGDFKIFGSSPESQLTAYNGVACINPIAGTVLRSNNQEEDLKLANKLKEDPKEKSEHVMLVDLARNDLSKSSEEVKVESYAEIQYFSHVIHMVSKVSGKLIKDKTGLNVYADTFPAGTLSGAPKYRALEIIAKNENISRNFYGGAIGYIGFNGDVNHAISIRSILSKNNTLVYQAGAGIVSESSPEGELREVDNKIKAIRKAIQKANKL